MYIAKKLCKFGGYRFVKGEAIPDELVLDSASARLIRCGVIAEVDGEGPLLPSLTSIEDNPVPPEEGTAPEGETAPEGAEITTEEGGTTPDGESSEGQENGEEEDWKAELTEENLMKKSRDELIELATALGLQFEKDDKKATKAIITEAILKEVQEIIEGEE